MNNKAFTIIELLSTIIIISIIMALVLPSALRVRKKNKTRIYTEYENMMVEYARISPLNKEDIIDLADLEELDKVKRECIGYVTIDHESEPNEYKAYISCGDDYETEGFNQEFKTSKGNGGENNDNKLTPTLNLRIKNSNGELFSSNNQQIQEQINSQNGYVVEVNPVNGILRDIMMEMTLSPLSDANETTILYEYTGDGDVWCSLSVNEEYGAGKAIFGITGPINAPLTVSNNKCSIRTVSSTSYETTYEVTCSNLPRGSNTITFQTSETEYFLAGSVSKTFDIPYDDGYVRIVYPENVYSMTASCNGPTSYTVNHHGGTLTCTTSNSSIATCSVSGNNTINITGVSSGSVSIIVKSAATDIYTEETATDYIDNIDCRSWHYNSNTVLACGSLCNSKCKELNSSSIWSCSNSDATPPTSYNATSGSHCWCYH